MDIDVVDVRARGDESKEVVVLRVRKKCNLQHYILFDNTYDSNGNPTNKHRHCYFFENHVVEAGDHIFLRTRKGKDQRAKTAQGGPALYLHWGLDAPVWNETGDVLHLIKVEDRETYELPAID